jgi:hypothetical protein
MQAMVHQMQWFAGTQVRNVGCVGGNVANASPISDLNPVLMSNKATMTIVKTDGTTRFGLHVCVCVCVCVCACMCPVFMSNKATITIAPPVMHDYGLDIFLQVQPHIYIHAYLRPHVHIHVY